MVDNSNSLEVSRAKYIGGRCALAVFAALSAMSVAAANEVLFNNGSIVTHPGGHSSGKDASLLQTNLFLNVLGFSCSPNSTPNAFRIADDFVVNDPNGWDLKELTLYCYQTNGTTASTITGMNYKIWNGPPNAGGTVVLDRSGSNQLGSTGFADIYRGSSLTAVNRPIYWVKSSAINQVLPAGTYWIDFALQGDNNLTGPWVPPVTILGQLGKPGSNSIQRLPDNTWAAIIDTGTTANPLTAAQDMPFILAGLRGTVTVTGSVTFTDLDSMATPPAAINMEIRTTGTTTVLKTLPAVALGSGGAFSVTTNPVGHGTFDLSAKRKPWLRRTLTYNSSMGDASGVNFVLVNGDADGDNEITLADYSLIANAFNSVDGDPNWNADADLNFDGEVNLADYAILARNFGIAGDD